MRRRRGFTLTEFLVVVAVIFIVTTVVVTIFVSGICSYPPYPHPPPVCTVNLKAIGKAFRDYAAENDGKFARVHTEGDPLAAPTDNNDIESISTNAMNQVWVLVYGGYLPAAAFHCPADERWTTRPSMLRHGWANASEFSYGIQYPFDHDPAGENPNPACPAAVDYKSDWVLMADRNPGTRVIRDEDWPNHPEGCNYLSMDGRVFFHKAGNSVVLGQEIYGDDSAADGDIFPDSAGDVVILPNTPLD